MNIWSNGQTDKEETNKWTDIQIDRQTDELM